MEKTVEEIAALLGGNVIGDKNLRISGITNIETPGPGLITFAQDEKGLVRLEASPIASVLVNPKLSASKKTLIQVPDPKLAWAKLLRIYYPAKNFQPSVSPRCLVAPTAKVGKNVTIEAFAILSEGAVIGDGAVIRSSAFVGTNVKVGVNSILHPCAVIYDDCEIGRNVIIHAGSVIGADGFGYVHTAEGQEKIPQVGNVIIEDDVEIGALVTIDRAAVGSTRIGKGTKIDNLVQIAHNVAIGPHTVISAQTGISGSSKIGSHVTMGGGVGVGDHVEIGDWTMVGAGAGFPTGKKIGPRQIVFGRPARPYQEARRQIAAQLRCAEMLEDIRTLKGRVAELEKQLLSADSSSPQAVRRGS